MRIICQCFECYRFRVRDKGIRDRIWNQECVSEVHGVGQKWRVWVSKFALFAFLVPLILISCKLGFSVKGLRFRVLGFGF